MQKNHCMSSRYVAKENNTIYRLAIIGDEMKNTMLNRNKTTEKHLYPTSKSKEKRMPDDPSPILLWSHL